MQQRDQEDMILFERLWHWWGGCEYTEELFQ